MTEIIKELNIVPGQPIELVALAVKSTVIKCAIVGTGQPITLRKVKNEIEGEILTVLPVKVWRSQHTHYMTGEIQSRRIDIPTLRLEPLALNESDEWNPEEEYRGEPGDPLDRYFEPIFDYGPRKSYEMEQVIPSENPENVDYDPILEAVDYHEAGMDKEAFKIMEKILTTDLRCLDAHAHLGNWEFNSTVEPIEYIVKKAKRHYQVGIEIARLTLGDDFQGVLPWACVDNRPYLRCLHGCGLSLWRLGQAEAARKIFEKMIWLNPSDNQGIRFLLDHIDSGKTWYSDNV